MGENKVLYAKGPVKIKLENRSNANHGKFRHFSRQVCGEVFDVPEDNQVMYCYEKKYTKMFQTGQMSFSLADLTMKEPDSCFDTEYYPQITFLFVHRDFQCQGYGSLLVTEGLKIIQTHCNDRPVRVQSALDAVPFFEKRGFRAVEEPYDCWHSGTRLFRTLVNMQHDCEVK